MKIAMLGHKRVPGRNGGVEVVVEELSTHMAAKGNNLVVYNRHKTGVISPREYKNVKIIDVPTIEKKNTDAVIYSFIASILVLFGKYDIIHYHAIGPSVFLLIPHLFGMKTVVTVHGLNYKTPKWKGIASKFIMYGEKIAAKYADQVIVLSKEQQKYFYDKYHRITTFIPNGTTIGEKAPANKILKLYGLRKDGYILFLSRVVPGKGVEYLLDAYKNVESDLPLIIAGDTEYLTEFREMIKKKASLDNRVKLIGFVEGDILRELYSNARLFVFPSEAEGMPLCLLEALSYDCHCLVSDIPENIEVGKDFVQLFESKNTEDLRDKIKKCLNNPELFKGNSREYVEKNYSWDNIVQSTLSIYKGIVKDGKI